MSCLTSGKGSVLVLMERKIQNPNNLLLHLNVRQQHCTLINTDSVEKYNIFAVAIVKQHYDDMSIARTFQYVLRFSGVTTLVVVYCCSNNK